MKEIRKNWKKLVVATGKKLVREWEGAKNKFLEEIVKKLEKIN